MKLAFLAVAAMVCLASTSRAFAQTIVHDGDDLSAVIGAAPSGTVIEIQGSGPFAGPFAWQGKTLTIRAGVGYHPTLSGAISLRQDAAVTGAELTGLRVLGSLTIWGSAGSGVGADARIAGSEFRTIEVDAAGSTTTKLHVVKSQIREYFAVPATGTPKIDIVLEESTVGSLFGVVALGTVGGKLELRRCRFRDELELAPGSANPPLAVLIESCLFTGGGAPNVGINIQTGAVARCVNCTVTGFRWGIKGTSSTSFENMLVYRNEIADVFSGTPQATVRYSLIEDGTFAGIDGNIAGTPLIASDYTLLAGSPGVDVGDDAAVSGRRDFHGAPRVQDGDGDGVARVDMGATEL
ncbi:MAG: hypothetical protein IT459_22330 [Planctomycetes bacterium]|nr:hypothetical protein [Planctomycetota bacterium]